MGARPAKQAGSEIQRTFDAVHSACEHVVTQSGGGGVEDVAGKLPWARSQPSGSGVDDEGVARAGCERIAVRCRSAARAGKMDLVPRESLSTTTDRSPDAQTFQSPMSVRASGGTSAAEQPETARPAV